MFLASLLIGCQPDWATEVDKSTAYTPEASIEPSAEIEPSVEPSTEEPLEPIANISVMGAYFIGDTVVFDGSNSHDPQGGALDFSWSCSNGESSSEESISFAAEEEGNVQCDLSVTSSSNLSASTSQTTRVLSKPEYADWTVMLFIAGDNNLEEAGIEDINEMEIAGSSAQVNLLVEFDRSPQYTAAEGDWSGARRFYITQDTSDEIRSPVMQDLGEIDSGDPREIADFAKWGIENYPAEKFAFIIWNHGWSWSFTNQSALLKGISSDDSTGNDITVAGGELASLLEEISFYADGKLEFLGFDACTMQSWEVAHIAHPYAKYLTASQDYVDFDGWDYEHSMQDLLDNPEMDGADLGEAIAYRFFQTGDATKSVLDLSKLPAFETALDNFASLMMENGSGQLFRQAARNTYSYDGSEWGEDHDIGGLLSYIANNTDSSELQDKASLAEQALDELVIINYVQDYYSDATGLSIYSPPYRDWGVSQEYLDANWSQTSLWDDMLVDFQ